MNTIISPYCYGGFHISDADHVDPKYVDRRANLCTQLTNKEEKKYKKEAIGAEREQLTKELIQKAIANGCIPLHSKQNLKKEPCKQQFLAVGKFQFDENSKVEFVASVQVKRAKNTYSNVVVFFTVMGDGSHKIKKQFCDNGCNLHFSMTCDAKVKIVTNKNSGIKYVRSAQLMCVQRS